MTRWAHAAVLLALVALAGCGDDDERRPPEQPAPRADLADPRGTGTGGGALAVEADPGGDLIFRPGSLQAEAGRVTLELVNPSAVAHSLCVESPDQGPLGCTGTFRGDRGTLRLRLAAGEYTFFCSVEGHRAAGMQGTLTAQ